MDSAGCARSRRRTRWPSAETMYLVARVPRPRAAGLWREQFHRCADDRGFVLGGKLNRYGDQVTIAGDIKELAAIAAPAHLRSARGRDCHLLARSGESLDVDLRPSGLVD